MELDTQKHLSKEALKKLLEACDNNSGHITAKADQHGGKVSVNEKVVYDSQSGQTQRTK